MSNIPSPLHLEDYNYDLPETAIAKFPLAQRDQAKLLVYSNGSITDRRFDQLPDQLPSGSQLFFNDTKVIAARLRFQKEATAQGPGAHIEVFLLHPLQPSVIMSQVMAARGICTWQCMIGNQRRWKAQYVLRSVVIVNGKETVLSAERAEDANDQVTFRWDDPNLTFAEVLEAAGRVPLPPYLKREVTEEDKPRYQTVYSAQEGAVAAPTAGLHFTPAVLEALRQQGFGLHYLTLHVSAGTFQPVKEDDVLRHPMHSEQVMVSQENLEAMLTTEGPIIAVGTTSLRTLESLYWYGVLLQDHPDADFRIAKLTPYQHNAEQLPSWQQSVENILNRMQKRGVKQLTGETEILIVPGYQFRACQGLITNFHLPKSTLILLIAALIGEDWRRVYTHALQQNYRFLSYGDSSLLLPQLLTDEKRPSCNDPQP